MKQTARHQALLAKASQASQSAQALLELGDYDGASNRAYYGMFEAARSALLHAADDSSGHLPKTHSGLLSLFSQMLVLPALLPKDLGRALKRAEEIRLVADYTDASVSQCFVRT